MLQYSELFFASRGVIHNAYSLDFVDSRGIDLRCAGAGVGRRRNIRFDRLITFALITGTLGPCLPACPVDTKRQGLCCSGCFCAYIRCKSKREKRLFDSLTPDRMIYPSEGRGRARGQLGQGAPEGRPRQVAIAGQGDSDPLGNRLADVRFLAMPASAPWCRRGGGRKVLIHE
jgi:hypothetical protein